MLVGLIDSRAALVADLVAPAREARESSYKAVDTENVVPLSNLSDVLAAFGNGQHSVTISDARAPDMPLVYVSPGFSSFSGYRREEVLGRNCRFLQRGERDQPGLTTLRAAILARSPCVVDLVNYRRDGTRMSNRLSMHPVFDAEGQLTFYVGLQSDVTALTILKSRIAGHFAEKGMVLIRD